MKKGKDKPTKGYKTDLHAHTAGISACASMTPAQMAQAYADAGYDGFTVANHYYSFNLPDDQCWPALMETYLEGYHSAKAAGEALGLFVLLAAEVRLDDQPEDYLLYGMDEQWLIDHPHLHRLSQQQLFETADAHGLLLYQAHPLRAFMGARVSCLRHVHGLESYNGNGFAGNLNVLAHDLAHHQGLLRIAGSDSHHTAEIAQRDFGVYLPERPCSGRHFVDMLRQSPVMFAHGKMIT